MHKSESVKSLKAREFLSYRTFIPGDRQYAVEHKRTFTKCFWETSPLNFHIKQPVMQQPSDSTVTQRMMQSTQDSQTKLRVQRRSREMSCS